MTTTWLAFRPRDTVFVRDGRSFDAAADTTAETARPSPTTIAGAIGAVLGISPADLRNLAGRSGPTGIGEVRGPVLARRTGQSWVPYFPFPADLVRTADEADPYVFRLAPSEPAGVTDLGDARASVARLLVPPEAAEPAEPLRAWIPGHVLARYLAGDLPAPGGSPLDDFEPLRRGERLADPLVPERRVGLARDDRSVRAGYLYQSTHLRAGDDWAFLAEYSRPGESIQWNSNHSSFGGKGRLADIEPAVMSWPASGVGERGPRVLVYLATPAVWPGGWRMPVPDGATLVAAATGEPEPAATVSPGAGWRDSRALRWAVPAGSVYLLEFDDAEAGAAWAREWHGVALRRGDDGAEPDLLRTAGFGVVLTGVWT
jgi:CRISPR type III-B/RAMP module-associated protein Cmr3